MKKEKKENTKKQSEDKFCLSKINQSLIIREDINTGSLPLWTYNQDKVGSTDIISYEDDDSSYTINPRKGMPGPIDHHFFRVVEQIASEIFAINKYVPKEISIGSPRAFLIKAGIESPSKADYERLDAFLSRTKGLIIDAHKRFKYYNLEQAKEMSESKKKRQKQADNKQEVDAPAEIPAWKWTEKESTVLLYSSIRRTGKEMPDGIKKADEIWITFGNEYHANLNSKQITKMHYLDVYKMIKVKSSRRLFEIICMYDAHSTVIIKYSDVCRLMCIDPQNSHKRAKQKIEEISKELYARGLLIKGDGDWFIPTGTGDWKILFHLMSGVTPRLRDYTKIHSRIIDDIIKQSNDSVTTQRDKSGTALLDAIGENEEKIRKAELRKKHAQKRVDFDELKRENALLKVEITMLKQQTEEEQKAKTELNFDIEYERDMSLVENYIEDIPY